jgi:hypothetical protein
MCTSQNAFQWNTLGKYLGLPGNEINTVPVHLGFKTENLILFTFLIFGLPLDYPGFKTVSKFNFDI